MRALTQTQLDFYEGVFDGEQATLGREYDRTPNGNPMGGRWVLRVNREFKDIDQYRSDLASRQNIVLKEDLDME